MPRMNTCVSSATTFYGFYLNLYLLVACVHVLALLFHVGNLDRLTLLFQSEKISLYLSTIININTNRCVEKFIEL